MKITVKEYHCPVCGNKQNVSTNHCGEIYSGCKKCKNTVLYCAEAAQKQSDGQCKINFYHFNLEHEEEIKKYKQLKKYLKGKGYKAFNVITCYEAFEVLKQHDKKIIDLYNVNQFENQYVSDIGRVHDWLEKYLPNKKIKSGYYLEF